MTTVYPAATSTKAPWEYVLEDLLEMSTCLRTQDKEHLFAELRKSVSDFGDIEVHPAFSLGRYLVVIAEEGLPAECWVYALKEKILWKQSTLGGVTLKNPKD